MSPYINKFNDLMQFMQHVKDLGKIPYTLRAYVKGLEHILEPIIKKISCIENIIKNKSKYIFVWAFIYYRTFKCFSGYL